MSLYFPDPRDTILWERVGTLAWIMGASRSDNPFRKYGPVVGPGPSGSDVWRHKLEAWDRGWDKASQRPKPRHAARRIAYLPRPAETGSALEHRRR